MKTNKTTNKKKAAAKPVLFKLKATPKKLRGEQKTVAVLTEGTVFDGPPFREFSLFPQK